MRRRTTAGAILAGACALGALRPGWSQQAGDAGPPAAVVDFNAQTVGAPSADFEAVIGDWRVAEAGGQRGYQVDGTRWRQGTPSVSLADQARRLYGDRYAEFLDGVRAFAFFPLAIHRGPAVAGDYRASVRFYAQAGRIDQAAGIAFDVQPNGNYVGVRANALEDNVLVFRIVRGRRTIIETIRATPTPTRTWHTLTVSVRGRRLTAELDGVQRVARDLEAPPNGRLALWSKADSQVLFDDFRVERP